eukprot:6212031-Pleurochrysis_carterae.AAC.8
MHVKAVACLRDVGMWQWPGPMCPTNVHVARPSMASELQNFRHSASVTYCPIRHWESGDKMAPLTHHSPSIHSYSA